MRCADVIITVAALLASPCPLLAQTEAGSPRPPPPDNLRIPEDLSEGSKRALRAGLEALEKAELGDERHLREAIALFSVVANRLDPECPLAHYHLGRAHRVGHQYSKARKSLEEAVSLNSKFYEALAELGDVLHCTRELAEARKTYDEAMRIHPTYRPALEGKARLLARVNELNEARELCIKALSAGGSDTVRILYSGVRAAMRGPSWSTKHRASTEHYEVVTDVSPSFAEEIAANAELVRELCARLYAPERAPLPKATIWVYGDEKAYRRSGGRGGGGGHFDAVFRRIVLYRHSELEATLGNLYHLVAHQHIHDYIEEVPLWLDEGLASYFGDAQRIRRGRRDFLTMKTDTDKLRRIQIGLQEKLFLPSSELMRMSLAEVNEKEKGDIYFAQAWATLTYLLGAQKGGRITVFRQKGGRSRLLETYLEALGSGSSDGEAYAAAFGRTDMGRFDRTWKSGMRKAIHVNLKTRETDPYKLTVRKGSRCCR